MVSDNVQKRVAELGKRIKNEIKASGYTQAEFASQLEITPSRLSNYITGARMPDVFTLYRIAEKLQVPLEYLYGDKALSSSFPKRYSLTVYERGFLKLSAGD